jgi:malate synthase
MENVLLNRMNVAPPEAIERDLPAGFLTFYRPLDLEFTPRQRQLIERRAARLEAAHAGDLPDFLAPSPIVTGPWRVELPSWCRDQRNQMTGPADDAELVVKMLNSGAPGVMLDLEDSMANVWPSLMRGIHNILLALHGELTYRDLKRDRVVGIEPSSTVIWNRVRGLHLGQGGVIGEREITSASLFDLAMIVSQVEWERLKHPLCFYIPKSESAEEATWWSDVFESLARARGWPDRAIRCMALVESHPLAFEMEEFLHRLRGHILGLNLGRWDYMASLIHFNLMDPRWVLPDRNSIPHDVAFFQRVRLRLADICHRRGALAIGGMTALFPSREDPELNARALAVLEQDKKNEAACFMDGAWTGHPDQNAIAVAQFPAPNQLDRRPQGIEPRPDLRPVPDGVGRRTVDGTRDAARTVIRYRNGVLNGKGASLLDGYMEDLATDRIYRLMIAQRIRHRDRVPIQGEGDTRHTPELVGAMFDHELERLIAALPNPREPGTRETFQEARRRSEEMIARGWFDPV